MPLPQPLTQRIVPKQVNGPARAPLVRIARNIADTPPPRRFGYPVRHDFWERAAPQAAFRLVPPGRGGRGRQLVGRTPRQRTGPVLGAAAGRARLRRRATWAAWSF